MQSHEFIHDHPCGLRIHRLIDEQSVAEVNGIVKRDMGNGFTWYDLPMEPAEDGAVSMSLCFSKGALDSLTLVVADSHRKPGEWDHWSESDEQTRAKRSGEWLASQGLPCGVYPWGEVWANHDPKGGFGSAGIRFSKTGR